MFLTDTIPGQLLNLIIFSIARSLLPREISACFWCHTSTIWDYKVEVTSYWKLFPSASKSRCRLRINWLWPQGLWKEIHCSTCSACLPVFDTTISVNSEYASHALEYLNNHVITALIKRSGIILFCKVMHIKLIFPTMTHNISHQLLCRYTHTGLSVIFMYCLQWLSEHNFSEIPKV